MHLKDVRCYVFQHGCVMLQLTANKTSLIFIRKVSFWGCFFFPVLTMIWDSPITLGNTVQSALCTSQLAKLLEV